MDERIYDDVTRPGHYYQRGHGTCARPGSA